MGVMKVLITGNGGMIGSVVENFCGYDTIHTRDLPDHIKKQILLHTVGFSFPF